MKHRATAVLAALGCCTGAAHAQSAVTLYGSMDLSVPWISNIRGERLVRMDSAIG